MGPERPTVMFLMMLLLCIVLFVAFFVPLTACTLTNDGAGCAPPAPLEVLPGGPVTILGACPCNVSLVIRDSPNARYTDSLKGVGVLVIINFLISSNARTLSVTTFLQPGPHPVDARGVTALSVLMAQFVANDIYLPRVPSGNLSTSTVPIPPDDPFFSPSFFTEISFPNVTTTPDPRTILACPDPISDTSPFIDLSQVYGTDINTLNSVLRGPRGTLAVVGSVSPLLPVNPDIPAYVMGDYRDNGSAALIAMHTLAVRNHNYWANQLLGMRPDWTNDQVRYSFNH